MIDSKNTALVATPNSAMGSNEVNDPPMAFSLAQYIQNKISLCLWNLEQLKNLKRYKFGINMDNNEQLCVNKELWGFDVCRYSFSVMKMFVEWLCIS